MSYLYPGFKFVGGLESISTQRSIQRDVISNFALATKKMRFLSIGSGFGDELDALFSTISEVTPQFEIVALDANVAVQQAKNMHFSKLPNIHLKCVQCNLENIERLPDLGIFDVVQIGFVLHDFDYDEKNEAVRLVAAMAKPGGHLILSEIFSDSNPPETEEIVSIYDRFLHEADVAKECGHLAQAEWEALVGTDSSHAGLRKTREDAAHGKRDYFETVDRTCARLKLQGMSVSQILSNEFHPNLSVIVAKR